MCKCCQSCLESCYWHCFEKWFCYDESIALSEDPLAEEKDRRGLDNVAFWDSVAVIANRSIVTIQPLPNKNNNTDVQQHQQKQPILSITKSSTQSENEQEAQPNIKPNKIVSNDTVDSASYKPLQKIKENEPQITITKPTPEKETRIRKQTIIEDTEQNQQRKELIVQLRNRKQSAIEEKIEQRQRSESNAQDRNRKKSLKERRKSAAGLTLKLDNDFHEIPVIRQSSMPRFYLDTPEIDTVHGNYSSGERSSILVSPILGNSPTFNYDLKSIVQIEKEIMAHQSSKPSTPKSNRSSKLIPIKKKFKPLSFKNPSSKSLPDSINHM